MFEYHGLRISWLGHDAFKIRNGKIIYIDPYEIQSNEQADIVLITHDHYDHCSLEDVEKIASGKTKIITTPAAKKALSGLKTGEIQTVKPGQKIIIDNVSIETIPSYNVNKFRSPGRPFHPKAEGMLGFIIMSNDVKIYHAGDADSIPEMSGLDVDIALLPVSGTYVMTPDEAAEASSRIKPKIAIPMHFGTVVGDQSHAERFKKLAECEVRILDKE